MKLAQLFLATAIGATAIGAGALAPAFADCPKNGCHTPNAPKPLPPIAPLPPITVEDICRLQPEACKPPSPPPPPPAPRFESKAPYFKSGAALGYAVRKN